MEFCVLGSGGRETSIIKKLQSYNVVCISNFINQQISSYVQKYICLKDIYNLEILSSEIIKIKPETVIIGSEKFLDLGIVDILEKNGINCIGPKKKLADIELSKSFARLFLTFNNLGKYNPKYDIIHNYNNSSAESLFNKYKYDFVIKDNGLCSGKGVRLYNYNNYKLGHTYISNLLKNNFTDKCLIEEKLYGKEFVLMSFCDGINIKHMPIVLDFKKIRLGSDVNTGSMGCIVQSDHSLPFLNESEISEAGNLNYNIMRLLSEDTNYKGILYGSFMKTDEGIKLIEYNARFGDPECLVIFEILKTDLGKIFMAINNQTLDEIDIEYENKNVICKYLVPPGYPEEPIKDVEFVLDNNDVIQAGLKLEDNKLFLNGSRTLAVLKKGDNFENIYQEIEKDIEDIKEYLEYRDDIGFNYIDEKIKLKTCDKNLSLYEKSGVNIEEGNSVVDKIKDLVLSTHNKYVIGNWGDFGGMFDISNYIIDNNIKNATLINSMDGVGTKSILSKEILGLKEGLKSLGQDIVNHCVNDIIVKGGIPLYFSDYVASDSISSDNMVYVLEGMSKACKENDCVLIGGETAEMPSIYKEGHYDIVGNITGILNLKNMINGKKDINDTDCIFGLLSEGPQTNGYSLIRYIMENVEDLGTLNLQKLVTIHKSYLKEIREISQVCNIKGLCHITGGGYYENIPRVIPEHLGVNLNIDILEPFKTLMDLGNVSKEEMFRVFNCGYGMLVFVDKKYKTVLEDNLKLKYLGKVVKRGIESQINIIN